MSDECHEDVVYEPGRFGDDFGRCVDPVKEKAADTKTGSHIPESVIN